MTSGLATRPPSRRSPSALAWVMIVGLVVTAPLIVSGGVPAALGAPELGWFAVAGVGNVLGLLLVYGALRIGKVSIVAPITSTEGAIAAVLAVATGEAIGVVSGVMLLVIAGSVALSAVLASQFAALSVLAAYVVFRERITRLQLVGVAAIAIGVAVLTALQA